MDSLDPAVNSEHQAMPSAKVISSSDPSSTGTPNLSTSSLEALQSVEQCKFMRLVDRLRRAGLSSVLQLPQIVVCGDQSSGKSSVLEAITEILFPRKENLCTRFATQIIMRRDVESVISCKINPDRSRTKDEQLKLESFSRSINDFGELPSLMDEATEAMGLNEHKAFTRDVLSIEICGPDQPQLTFVDLPGLIHSANKSQSEEDVQLISSLVEDYISEDRTIILAIISAKNDYANQVILKNCRKFDPKGARTFGVITKPDYLHPSSDNERVWLDLAQNRDIYFELGWHLLKNHEDGEHHLSFMERNLKERAFFNNGSYRALPQRIKGIDSLRGRLSQLLFHHLKRELPILKGELDSMARTAQMQLQLIGKSRATLTDQRVYLAELFSSAYDIVLTSMNGNYEGEFFGRIDITAPIDGETNLCRLRAVVQHLNIRSDDTDAEEHSTTIPEEQSQPEAFDPQQSGPVKLTRKQANKRVVQLLQRSRGREIPGIFNPMLISHLFWEQSERWDTIAREHINRVAATCRAFLHLILDYTAAPEIKPRLLNLTVLPALENALNAAFNELRNIEKDKQRHPITYNHYFTDTLQKVQRKQLLKGVKEASGEATVVVDQKTWTRSPKYEKKSYIDPDTFHGKLPNSIERDMDKVSAEAALDAHAAYYKAEKKYFIDVVTKQVIERHLVAPLAEIFSPITLARYTDRDISFLASESPEVVQMREHLESKCKMLKEGQEAFRAVQGQSIC
uniref:VPS1/SPO15 protein n=1 Tax=Coccidioides posadasii RMSCC 3488 TaxID=454284 RepID=A0A0J6F7U8_COCPO|nr:VPS1/SPO15 protein [Coccidioides posadasii RMSCC 3488]